MKVDSQNGTWVDIDLLCGSAAVQSRPPPDGTADPDDATWDPKEASKVSWKFSVYIDFITAILEGIDEFEIAITDKKRVRTPYFSGDKSPTSVSQDIRSYIKRFKDEVKETDEEEEFVSKTFGITEFLDDNIVSDISSGIITKKNKKSKYPEYEVTYARRIKGRSAKKFRKNYRSYPKRLLRDSDSVQELGKKLYNDTGWDPAWIGFINYPIIPDEDLESGTFNPKPWRRVGRKVRAAGVRYPVDENGKSTISSTDLGKNDSSKQLPDALYQLYNKYVKIERRRGFDYHDVRKKKVRVQYIPTNIIIDQIFDDGLELSKLLKKRSIWVEVQWKSKGQVIQTERYRISPRQIASRLSASANKYRGRSPTTIGVRNSSRKRDQIIVRNRGYRGARPEIPDGFKPWTKKTVFIYATWAAPRNRGVLRTKQVSKELLGGNRRWRSRPRNIPRFGTRSYPRSYRIATTDAAAQSSPICNINWITTPKGLRIRPDINEADDPAVCMTAASDTTARVIIGGIPSTVTYVKFKVKKVNTLEIEAETEYNDDSDGKNVEYTKWVRNPRTRPYSYRTIGKRMPLEDGATYKVNCLFYVGGTLQKDLAAEGIYTHYAGANSAHMSEAAKRVTFSLAKAASTYNATRAIHNMTLSQTISESVESEFLSQVNADGQAELYSQELEESKTETAITVSYMIERLNWNTGRIEPLIKGLSGETVSEYISANGKPYPLQFAVSGEEALGRFTYIVKANILESAGLSYTTLVKEVDPTTGNQYLYRYRKWRNNELETSNGSYSQGILPAVQTIIKDDMNNAIDKSLSGITSAASFQPSRSTPKLRSIKVYRDINNETNWLSWRVSGDESAIDHFIITAEYNGFRAPIGAAAVLKAGREFVFCENKLFGLFGDVEYKVYLVLKDFRVVGSRRSAVVKYYQDIPNFAFVNRRRRRRRRG